MAWGHFAPSEPVGGLALVAQHRRAHAAGNAERFRFGGHAPAPRPSAGPVAVLGASGWALDSERVEQTLAYLGALGGLLADLGYDVFAVSSLPSVDARASFVGWVGGEETADEQEQLAALDAPGLSVGAGVDSLGTWSSVEPEGPPSSIEFIRRALHEIRRLIESSASQLGEVSAGPSTVSSTLRDATGGRAVVRNGTTDSRNPISRAQSGTGWDSTNERSSGSWPDGRRDKLLLSTAGFTEVSNTGHFIALERPDVPAQLLNSALDPR